MSLRYSSVENKTPAVVRYSFPKVIFVKNENGKIVSVEPSFAIPGGEIRIRCEGTEVTGGGSFRCLVGESAARVVGASSKQVLAIIPEQTAFGAVDITIEHDGGVTEAAEVTVGKKLAGELHQVSNPAIDPHDDSVILTRSGTRGQMLPVTLFRLGSSGELEQMGVEILNPTGLAFDPSGRLLVTNRAEGELLQVNDDREALTLASDLGVATGLAFDDKGDLYIGDRNGTIFKMAPLGDPETWAILEPSVSAYHMAFGPDGSLYVTAPGLCSHDVVYRLDESGSSSVFYKGLGRPQGLAFDDSGNLYVAACLAGRHGVVRISPEGEKAEQFAAGMGIVGLCFSRTGDLIAATNDEVYSIPTGIFGTLLERSEF